MGLAVRYEMQLRFGPRDRRTYPLRKQLEVFDGGEMREENENRVELERVAHGRLHHRRAGWEEAA